MTLLPAMTLALALLPFNLPTGADVMEIEKDKEREKITVIHEVKKVAAVRCAACGKDTTLDRSVCDSCEAQLMKTNGGLL